MLLRVDPLPHQCHNCGRRGRFFLLHGSIGATAGNRRQKGHFVAVVQDAVGGGKLGIHADSNAAQIADAAQVVRGVSGGELLQQVCNRGSVAQLNREAGCTEPLFQDSKWEYAYLHVSKQNNRLAG